MTTKSTRLRPLRAAAWKSVAAVGIAVSLASTAGAFDLHQFWDQRCKSCHGHSAEFAREHLSVVDGQLKGKHHRDDLKLFLSQHEMGPELAEPIAAMLLAQASTPPLFQSKCAGCHKTAAEFARSSLEMKDGQLTGKASGKPVAQYLAHHGKLTPDEVPVITGMLARVLGETVGGAAK